MTEKNIQKNQTKNTSKEKLEDSSKKEQKSGISFLTKITIIAIIVLAGYLTIHYQAIQNEKISHAKEEVKKFDNIESDIFEISEDSENKLEEKDDELSEISASELQEKGENFIYKMLLKNQIQLNDLKDQVKTLTSEFSKYKNHEKLGRMLLAYFDLRQKVFSNNNQNYEESLKNLEIITALDESLHEKVIKLKDILKNFPGEKSLSKKFNNIIPNIIVTKNQGPESNNPLSKISRSISKLITIRKIDEKNTQNIDGKITRIESLLRKQKYQEALTLLSSLDPVYREATSKFLNDLVIASDLQKIDQEIFSYLQNLSSVMSNQSKSN